MERMVMKYMDGCMDSFNAFLHENKITNDSRLIKTQQSSRSIANSISKLRDEITVLLILMVII